MGQLKDQLRATGTPSTPFSRHLWQPIAVYLAKHKLRSYIHRHHSSDHKIFTMKLAKPKQKQ
jgi:hypothetical protein